MSKIKIRQQNDTKKKYEEEWLFNDIQNEPIDMEGIENVLQEDANVFLLNNLMMSVQFFENYERDIKVLRENWFKEFSLDPHHKKCFYADSLFRLSGASVKFSPRHGPNKNSESLLHPLRMYISSDNVEAAFDPTVLGRHVLTVWPEYQFTARIEEKKEKSGCVSLIEFRTIEEPTIFTKDKAESHTYAIDPNEETGRASIYMQNKSNLDDKSNRRLTKTETSIGFLNKNMNLIGKRFSIKYFPTPEGTIPVNSFYKFENLKTRLKPKMIHDFRMNSVTTIPHEIPQFCFQYEEIRNVSKKVRKDSCFKTQKILNAAAFKGYFCDLLIEKLAENLNLNTDAVDDSTVLEEFIIINQNGVKHCIAPVIKIIDWNNLVALERFRNSEKSEELTWPSTYMQKIMKILPCYAVPSWHSYPSTENLDYEKSWKLVFPKTEEFLILHMMHAHVRCYFFLLLLYKSFIEPQINGASFGPKHLMHLLFWKVHRNFLAWPEDRPAETFLNYLKTLYKKLQNKYLPDFFITSRNLFAASQSKDLHMTQSLIKKIIENPVPYIIRAISNLNLKYNFFPSFDYLKLNNILKAPPVPVMIRKIIKKEKQRKVRFEMDEEQLWAKNVIKQIESEKKAEKQETARMSAESVNVNEIINFESEDWEKCTQILQMFASHFLLMGDKCMKYDSTPQGLMYLNQTQKLLQLMTARGIRQENLKETRDKINRLKQSCCGKIKQQLRKSQAKDKNNQDTPKKLEINSEAWEEDEESKASSKDFAEYFTEFNSKTQIAQEVTQITENDTKVTQEVTQITENDTKVTQEVTQITENDTKVTQEVTQITENDTKVTQEVTQITEFESKGSQDIYSMKEELFDSDEDGLVSIKL